MYISFCNYVAQFCAHVILMHDIVHRITDGKRQAAGRTEVQAVYHEARNKLIQTQKMNRVIEADRIEAGVQTKEDVLKVCCHSLLTRVFKKNRNFFIFVRTPSSFRIHEKFTI